MEKVSKFYEISRDWLELKKFSIKESSYHKYKTIIEKHLDIIYDNRDVDDFDEYDYRSLFYLLFEESELSVSMKNTIKFVLKGILAHGEKKYGLEHVDFSYIKIAGEKKNVTALSIENIQKLSNYCYSNINNASLSIHLSLYTGMRIGEICGLKWEDIDLDKAEIKIDRTMARLPIEGQENKTIKKMLSPKTKSSKRTIVMTNFTVEYLRHYQSKQSIESNDCYVITSTMNMPEVRNIQRKFKRICKRLDININFHILRHTFATTCIKYQMDVKTLCELLGHSNVATTLNLYVHPTLEEKKHQINKIPK